jgi:sarcosine oxidase/L-pipecolate oxidase
MCGSVIDPKKFLGDTRRHFRSGVLVLGSADGPPYASKSYANDVALGVRVSKYDPRGPVGDAPAPALPRTIFPQGVKLGPTLTGGGSGGVGGFLNLDSGWAAAARAVEMLMTRVVALGGKVLGGKTVTGLVREDDGHGGGRTCGVRLADGSSIRASLVVIASGSWTASTFRELELNEKCVSTG